MTLARWDARWKLAAILFACAIIACLQSPRAAAIAFAISLLFAAFATVTAFKLASRLGLIAFSLVPFLIILPFDYDSQRGLIVSNAGSMLALTIALRALAIGTLAYVLIATGPVERIAAAAQSLGMPGPLTQVLLLTHRYSSTIVDEVRRLRIAWRVRAFQSRTTLLTYRTYAHGIGAVLVRSGERGERVSEAMRARGFDGTFHQAVPFHATLADAAVCFALVLPLAGLAVWERLA